jgi:hypothetical protein
MQPSVHDVAPGPQADPTQFAELNDVLFDVTGRAADILGNNFVLRPIPGASVAADAAFPEHAVRSSEVVRS